MKLRLLPSSFENDGSASAKQHLTCFVVNERVAIDAGSLAMGVSDRERSQIRDVILTHAHLDHIAGLPLFLDDLFSTLSEPVRIHASEEVIEVLERDVFNWSVYPRFSELTNSHGPILKYVPFRNGSEIRVGGLKVKPLAVNHKVPSSGFVIQDENCKVLLTGDTASLDDFWKETDPINDLDALLIECAFPDELGELADTSHHLTPSGLKRELDRFGHPECPKYVVNIKPTYRETVVREIMSLELVNVHILEVGHTYEW